jgi:hypothetical protein
MGARLDGMTNGSELLINIVMNGELKMLISSDQKVCGWLIPCKLGLRGHYSHRWIGRV